MADALLALGGNVGDVRDRLNRAVELMCDGNRVRLVARSSDYRTPPWGVEDQAPFINLCLVVSTTLLSMGMMQLPPAMISLPFKILLFVMIDGWNLLVNSIVRSFI